MFANLPGMFTVNCTVASGLAPIAATTAALISSTGVPTLKFVDAWSDHCAVSFALNAKYLKRSVPFFCGFLD